MKGQMTIDDYLKSQRRITFGGSDHCICRNCLYWWSQRCPHGECYDDYRASYEPYDKAHPDRPPRKAWSDWDKPGEQAHWCRGGIFYPISYCEHFVKYKGCTIKECLKCNVAVYQDEYIDCSMLDACGCEKCYEEFEKRTMEAGE